MLKLVLIAIFPFLLFFGDQTDSTTVGAKQEPGTGTLKRMVPEGGTVTLQVDFGAVRSGGLRAAGRSGNSGFELPSDSLLPVLIFNNEVRTPLPGSIALLGTSRLPRRNAQKNGATRLVLETTPWGSDHEMIIRDSDGSTLFDVDGLQYEFDASQDVFYFQDARLLLSADYAKELGDPAAAGSIVGTLALRAEMRAIEITNMVDGDVQQATLPASPSAGSVPGPDVVVGDLFGLAQFGAASGTQVGLAVGTESCNFGTVDLNWFASPGNDHPVIPQNLYRMSGGPNNTERFEQIGQSSVKHAFTALADNICSLGCNGVSGSHLGSGCSDPYSASLNSGSSGNSLGSRAWINPFSGAYPRADGGTPPNSHTGHTHTGPSHRILVEIADLNTAVNPGATYFAEGQYVTPHEYAWCQTHPGQCNMYNNVSHRQYLVQGTGSPFTFSPSTFTTVREKPAVSEWAGATGVAIQPEPGVDGVGSALWKVTNTSPGVWHYEYAIYNQNLDRAIRSLDLPMGTQVSLSNIGFHAPPQHPGSSADGTFSNLGYSSTPWSSVRGAGDFLWSTETFAQNQNANAVRWGTLYNFRFDSNFAPMTRPVTIGFFKTGAPIIVLMQVPTALVSVSGRVVGTERGVANARVSIQGDNGFLMSTVTDRKGRFTFNNVPSGGGAYTVTAVQRRFTFTPQTIAVNDSVSNVAVTAP